METTELLTDLTERLERAYKVLTEMAKMERGKKVYGVEKDDARASHLEAKAAGVRLALSYIADYGFRHD